MKNFINGGSGGFKFLGMFVFMFMLVFGSVGGFVTTANSAETGVYVAPKFMFDVPQANYLERNHSGSGGSYKDTTGVGGAFAVGYDFTTLYDVSIRTELEYAIRTDANFKYEGRNRIAQHPQSFFANVYYDFDNSSDFTPYVGGGLGMSVIGEKNTNFAWNVGGGIAYDVATDWKLDLGYRYVDLGKFENRHTKASYSAHEVLMGVRYTF